MNTEHSEKIKRTSSERFELRCLKAENKQLKSDREELCLENIRLGRQIAQAEAKIRSLIETNKQLTAKWQEAEAELRTVKGRVME